ncbi:hypothetical protein [Chryseobacterium phosphatilyticum]|uniref:hypothetical protein n=1 Tax=Chryseobacterium phosphatilyticum TaxID=475075 RepID=UPI000F50489B|nr:hypothetical protein [Chryseobacterium phosphatilyticum]
MKLLFFNHTKGFMQLGTIPFDNFINYNQTSKNNYINGWVRYKDGDAFQRNFNIIMTKYGVKTIK